MALMDSIMDKMLATMSLEEKQEMMFAMMPMIMMKVDMAGTMVPVV